MLKGLEMQHIIDAAKTQVGTLHASLIMVCVYLLVSGFADQIGKAEGSMFPVVADVELLKVEKTPYGTIIEGTARKERPCDFLKVEWFLNTKDGISPARMRSLEGTKVRPTGDFKFGPWVVALTPDELLTSSSSQVRHRCHWFFPTITRFYAPPGKPVLTD